MKFLHIDNSKSDVALFNKYIKEGKHVFALIFMEGCGPCNQTIPKWKHIETVLKKQYADNDNVVIADINKDLSSFIKNIGPIEAFPTMKYIGNNGNKIETYEESNIPVKDRSTDSFIKWIETKINRFIASNNNTTRTKRRQHGGALIFGGKRKSWRKGGAILLGGKRKSWRTGGAILLGGKSKRRRTGGAILLGGKRKSRRKGGALIF